jgi:hypothetical protein
MRLGLRIRDLQQHVGMARLIQWAPADQILPAQFSRGKAEWEIPGEGLDRSARVRN